MSISVIADLDHLLDTLPTEKLDPRLERLNFHAANARSHNTNLAYRQRWLSFQSWCEKEGLSPFPAEASTVILFLDHLVEAGYKGATVQQAYQAIKAVHADHDEIPGASAALAAMTSTRSKAAYQSLKRILGQRGKNRVDRPRAFTQVEVEAMARSCPDTNAGVQERALLLLGVNAGLRGSEYGTLTVKDHLRIDEEGMEIRIDQSKSDQEGTGETIFVGRLAPTQRHLDAVAAMEAHLERNKDVIGDGAIFVGWQNNETLPNLRNGKTFPLARYGVSGAMRRMANRAALMPTNQGISSHSLRHTFITQCYRSAQHISEMDIAKVTRHKNLSVLQGYNQQERREAAVSPRLWN